MDDLFEEILDVASPGLPIGRVLNWMLWFGVVGILPSALIAGSGGHGAGFNSTTFAIADAVIVILAGVGAYVTSPRARKRRRERRA